MHMGHTDYMRFASAGIVLLLALATWLGSGSRTAAGYVLLAGCMALMTPGLQCSREDVERALKKVFSAAVIVGLLVPVLMASIKQFDKAFSILGGQNGGQQLPVMVMTAIAFAGTVLIVMRSRVPEWQKAVGLLLVMFGVKLGYVYFMQVANVSDFRSMVRLTDRLIESGWKGPDELSSTGRIHLERIVFYLYPLRLMFGKGDWVYEGANILAITMASGMSWWLARRFFSMRAATFALVMTLFAFEPLQAAEITSHDIPGALSLMVCFVFYVLTRDNFQNVRGIFLSVVFGFCIAWLAVQRGIGSVFLVLFIAYEAGIFASNRLRFGKRDMLTDFRRIGLVVLVPVIIYGVASSMLTSAGIKRSASEVAERRFIAVSSHTESWSNGSYGFKKSNWLHRELAEGEGVDFVFRRYVSDIYHSPSESISMYVRKAQRLFNTGMHQGFYLNQARIKGMGELDRQDRDAFRMVSAVASAGILTLLLCALWQSRKACFGMLSDTGFPLFFLASFSLVMILLAEVQARYLFPLWFIAPIYIGAFLAKYGDSDKPRSITAS